MLKMFYVYHLLTIIVLSLEFVTSAPNDNGQLKELTQSSKLNEDKLDVHLETNNDSETKSGLRQKRWYNYYGYGFPPVNPIIYPNYVKRDGSDETAVYGAPEDPFRQIYRRLADISAYIRQPTAQPVPSQFPFFFPVIFVPHAGCRCFPNDNSRPTTPSRNNDTAPDVNNRFPDMEDTRQNWGIVIENDTRPATDGDDYDDDNVRPISFGPLRPNRPSNRPTPPVEHGSNQAGSNQGESNQIGSNSGGSNTGGSNPGGATSTSQGFRPGPLPTPRPSTAPTLRTTTFAPISTPTPCDGAILSCCHQPQVTYDCFASQGCPDLTSYGNPCDPTVILRVIDRFQQFYGQRTFS